MPLLEINGEMDSDSSLHKVLKSSRWRKLAGVVGFFQLSSFMLLTLILVSGAFIQVLSGVAPYHYEILHAISAGVLVRCLHIDIMESHNFDNIITEANRILDETEDEQIIAQRSMSTSLKAELTEADWGMVLTLLVFLALVTANQCWNGAHLLRASLKWQEPSRAFELMESWSNSITSFRNYLFGFIVSCLLFASQVTGVAVLILFGLWVKICIISACANGYYHQLAEGALRKDDDEV